MIQFKIKNKTAYIFALTLISFVSCNKPNLTNPAPEPDPDKKIYTIPVVVHVIHKGEAIGTGYNLSKDRIESQIRVINEDFRRKEGTRGFNTNPDGGDARIEFVLAKVAPDGTPTDGIVRVDTNGFSTPPPQGSLFERFAHFSYWDPEKYLNVWTIPLHESSKGVFLGEATGPETDLPGAELLVPGEPLQPEGVLINSYHFGVSNDNSEYNLGRTLTHEIGHYLGLLHTWGDKECDTNDYCEDTPPVTGPIPGCAEQILGCNGQPAMAENYMNFAHDRCVNTFTNDQIARMHYVLENSPRRRTLLESPVLGN